MRIKAGFLAALVLAGPALSQNQTRAEDPLSVIDWLNDSPAPAEVTRPSEPPVSTGVNSPEIEVQPLESTVRPLGLVPPSVTGLPVTVWDQSDPDRLISKIARAPVADSPAMQALIYSLLLSESNAPAGGKDALALARIDRLLQLGAVDPALALARRADPTASPDLFGRWFDATLLTGQEDQSCRVMLAMPHLAPGYDARIFCIARLGDWQTAALMLENARVLGLLPQDRMDLMDRFLSPDLFDGAKPLPVPGQTDPLGFRLHETIGERLPTTTLPRAFATADLRDVAGWKAQLEAAERLTRVGALSPNQMLGLYTERLPAASGGVWDRVEALQRFETALRTRNPNAVAGTLGPVWDAMTEARLEVPFAELFTPQLAKQVLQDPRAAALSWKIQLLSGDYERAAQSPPDDSQMTQFLAALARGEPQTVASPSERARAIAAGFENAPLPTDLAVMLNKGQLGEAILTAMTKFHDGARGNPAMLTSALATLRRVGLEDTARRAALQLMLLDRG